jgi:hypothetical protein
MPDDVLLSNAAAAHAVSADGLAVIGQAQSVSVGSLYLTLNDAVEKAVINNVYAQQQVNMTGQAASTASVTNLLNLPI